MDEHQMKDEALRLALEALEIYVKGYADRHKSLYPTITAIKQALEAEQEPVAWLIWLHGPAGHFDHKQFAELEFERRNKEYPDPDRKLLPLYTSPQQAEGEAPKREGQGLTDEEIGLLTTGDGWSHLETPALAKFARAIEAKLKEKNT